MNPLFQKFLDPALYWHGKMRAGRLVVRQHWQVSCSSGTNSIQQLACAVRLTYENSKCMITQLPNLTVQEPIECATTGWKRLEAARAVARSNAAAA